MKWRIQDQDLPIMIDGDLNQRFPWAEFVQIAKRSGREVVVTAPVLGSVNR